MAGVSGIGSNSYSNIYGQLSSGKKINSAADGASESAIIQKEKASINGMDAGSDNIQSGISALNISDGALSQVTDYLQGIRDLAVQAGNGLLNDDDRSYLQSQVNQYKQGISDIVGMTNYNGLNLLDGGASNVGIVTDSEGGKIDISSGSLMDKLGISDFDVTGKFDIKTIDNALKAVNSMRSHVGSQTNALEYAYNMNQNTSYNLTSSVSKLEDLDIPKAVSEKKKQDTLQAYALMMQKKRQEQEAQKMNNLFNM